MDTNFFNLFAHGDNFNVDAFLKTTPLKFDKIWYCGDSRGGCGKHPTSGIEKVLGQGRKLSMNEQDQIAAEFLKANEEALKHLAQFPGVNTFVLGLHYYIELSPSTCGFCMSASAQLMHFALRTGVDLTFYVDCPHSISN